MSKYHFIYIYTLVLNLKFQIFRSFQKYTLIQTTGRPGFPFLQDIFFLNLKSIAVYHEKLQYKYWFFSYDF